MADETTLVLLPGLDGTGVMFRPLLPELPADVRPIVVPYPGFRVLDYPALVDEVWDRLPRDRPFVLLGESFGGPLSMMVAARRPPGLVGLILCATFVTSPWPVLGPLLRPIVGPWPFRLYPLYKRYRRWLEPHGAPALRPLEDEMVRMVDRRVMAARVRMVFAVDAREQLKRCDVPMLYLQGLRDRVVRAGNLARILQVRPDVAVARFDAPHMLLKRTPAKPAAAIAAFVRRHAGVTPHPVPG